MSISIMGACEEENDFPEMDLNRVVKDLIKSGLKTERMDNETSLTLLQEERVLRILAQSVIDPIRAKVIKEEDLRRALEDPQMSLQGEAHDYVRIIEMAYPEEDFSAKEKREMAKKFKQVPGYKWIREQILISGDYDVRKIKSPEKRKIIQDIVRNADDDILKQIPQLAEKDETRDAVFSMIELMAGDPVFTQRLPLLLNLLDDPNILDNKQKSVLHYLANVGNVEALVALLTNTSENKTESWGKCYQQQDLDDNTFLHIFAEKYNLEDLFDKIEEKSDALDENLKIIVLLKNQSGLSFLGSAFNNIQETKKDGENEIGKGIEKALEIINETCGEEAMCTLHTAKDNKGHTFFTRVLESIQKTIKEKKGDPDQGIQKALEVISNTCGEQTMSTLCSEKDKKGNTLLHLAVLKSQKNLISYLLPRTGPNPDKVFNSDGHNAFHIAVYQNDSGIIKHILDTMDNTFNVNEKMLNGETALHLAAKQGNLDVLEELIKHGGDLAHQDTDGHTPLHDCLQQVYFEGGFEDEQICDKFIRVWNKVVDEAVTWWCTKKNLLIDPKRLAMDPKRYLPLQYEAVYYLRSCIKNTSGYSVLQYAAHRGLVTCVQAMLTTKDVFFISFTEEDSSWLKKSDFKIDVTNLCPEYSVTLKLPYTEKEKKKEENQQQYQDIEKEHEKRGDENNKVKKEELSTFLDALAIVKPGEKAGEILESIPMVTLTKLQWSVYQWFSIIWMLIHFLLMSFITYQSKREISTAKKGFLEKSSTTSKMDVLILIYSSLVFLINVLVKITMKWNSKLVDQVHEIEKRDSGILSKVTKGVNILLDKTEIIVRSFFFAFTWAVFIASLFDINTTDYAWIKGSFLLFGWLVLLIPLRSYSPVYQLIEVLKYITITDMFPWILLYITISSAFASAIQLQFQLLPDSPTCIDEEHEMKGTLPDYIQALFELILMTTGLDTEITQVQNVGCVFKHNQRKSHAAMLLITLYAVISAVVLLNMLIAIMSNTLSSAQRGKGWRQYQVQHALWLREFICFFCCRCRKSKIRSDQRNGKQTGNDSSSSDDIALKRLNSPSRSECGDNQQEKDENETDCFMDRWVRGKKNEFQEKENNGDVWYDPERRRWFLKLETLDVKEIRARHLIT